jgi:hypothetical protein
MERGPCGFRQGDFGVTGGIARVFSGPAAMGPAALNPAAFGGLSHEELYLWLNYGWSAKKFIVKDSICEDATSMCGEVTFSDCFRPRRLLRGLGSRQVVP